MAWGAQAGPVARLGLAAHAALRQAAMVTLARTLRTARQGRMETMAPGALAVQVARQE